MPNFADLTLRRAGWKGETEFVDERFDRLHAGGVFTDGEHLEPCLPVARVDTHPGISRRQVHTMSPRDWKTTPPQVGGAPLSLDVDRVKSGAGNGPRTRFEVC
jgi:hypothetical protein